MKEIIAVINQKGGVGKSTTAHALGAGLARRGNKVLFIDLDAQANLTYALIGDTETETDAAGLLRAEAGVTAEQVTIKVSENIYLIPAGSSLSGADLTITGHGKEYRLKEALSGAAYDYIVLDTPPALGILTVNALTTCTGVVIPAGADIFSLRGIGQLCGNISEIKRVCNNKLRVMGILLTRYNPRTVISRDMADTIKDAAKQLNTKLFAAPVRECVSLKEAQVCRADIFTYAPKSNAAADYDALVNEIIEGE